MNIRVITSMAVSLVLIVQPSLALALVGGPTLEAQLFETSVSAGGQFTVAVYMNTKAYSVTSAELHLTFPADRLQALSVQPGSFLPSVVTVSAIGPGTASITVGSSTVPRVGTGTVALIYFRALTAGSALVAFASDTQVTAVGQSGNAVDTMGPTTVTVAALAGAPTPTPSSLIGGAGSVATGPMETGLIALIMGAIAVLAYAGYTGTEEFRRNEARSIAASERTHEPDFKR